MATDLYDVLELDKNATTDQIRKAYKRRALQTHPDRQPADMTEVDKEAANEKFRKVNNAYEVLSDPEKRQQYDAAGVWPPPTSSRPNAPDFPSDFFDSPFTRGGRGSRQRANDPFNDPFFGTGFPSFPSMFGGPPPQRHRSRPHQYNQSSYGFTDPFQLFNQMFGDLHDINQGRGFGNSYRDPFLDDDDDEVFGSGRRRGGVNGGPGMGAFGSFGFGSPMMNMMLGGGAGGRGFSTQSMSSSSTGGFGNGNGGRWVSESRMTRTINGVTESIVKRKDSQGNEHVTHTYPDGRERHTLNGIEQDSSTPRNDRYIQQPPPHNVTQPGSRHGSHSGHRFSYDNEDDTPVIPRDPRHSHRSSQEARPHSHHSHHSHHSGRDERSRSSRGSAHNRSIHDDSSSDDDPVVPGAFQDRNAPRHHEDHRHSRNPLHFLHRHRDKDHHQHQRDSRVDDGPRITDTPVVVVPDELPATRSGRHEVSPPPSYHEVPSRKSIGERVKEKLWH
ncbi:DnaJ-domain-containing protein [Stereum hirsutum FP-91666 SS1]|uniref:DnaJ-domain-containing protein n=1 Tax=Stereum hirsutum (strain FP-91666) TaxID=721885 RepID=UPI000440A9BB|nr:DnaJ-domain-containing protein [Stereum hirsutum FP-91666 SS1]EIM86722.1 DnaJ-domain-containing protein [Stereum hirsutum FP-91666 SS1]